MGHEILRRRTDRSVLEQLRDWFRGRCGTDPAIGCPASDTVLTSTGRLCPNEDESSAEFTERVAGIKAAVLRRALAALAAEGAGDELEELGESATD